MTLGPGLRKFALTAHVACSVGWLGAVAGFLALAVAGLSSRDPRTVAAVYPAMELVTVCVIVPLSLASLLTGLIQALGTPWGLFRHYWVLSKLLLTSVATVVLLLQLGPIGYLGDAARGAAAPIADLRALGISMVIHAAGGLLVLLLTTILSVYKPRGLTPYGQRKQHEQRKLLVP
jgi:putative copper export protein